MGACTLMGSIYQIFSGMFVQSVGDFNPVCGPDCDVGSNVDDLKLVVSNANVER